MIMSVIELKNISFAYPNNPVIKNLDYDFEEGKVYAITGKSGAGKTTLLSLLSGIMEPTSGYIAYKGYPIDESDKYVYRSRDVGVIFQEYNLLPKFTVRENIQLSFDISGKKLKEIGNRRILHISGGQQQRIAIARALSFQPSVILADEPTGNLDLDTSIDILNVFTHLAHELNRCVIIVTHSPQIAELADIRLDLQPFSRYLK